MAVALLIGTGGCEAVDLGIDEDVGDEGQSCARGRKLTVAQARRLDIPVYWFGRSYRGLRVAEICLSSDRTGVSIEYGERACDPGSGCSYEAGVYSDTKRRRDYFPARSEATQGQYGGPVCFNRIGRARAINCLEPDTEEGEETLLSGKGAITIDSFDPRDLRSLTHPAGERLPAPVRLRCAEMLRMPRWAQRKVPSPLAPARACG